MFTIAAEIVIILLVMLASNVKSYNLGIRAGREEMADEKGKIASKSDNV